MYCEATLSIKIHLNFGFGGLGLIKMYFKKCLDCDCIGVLRKKGRDVYLSPEEILTTRCIRTRKRDLKEEKTWKKMVTAKISLEKHGNSTNLQLSTYLLLGSIFWIGVMLIGRHEF